MSAVGNGDVEDIVLRLRRIEGQIRGLQRMIEERRDCEEVVTQLIAVRAALEKVGALAMERYIAECTVGPPEAVQEKLQRTVELLLRLSR